MKTLKLTWIGCLLVAPLLIAHAENRTKITVTTPTTAMPQGAISLKAKLMDPEKNAKTKTAVVAVEVVGVSLVDPALSEGKPVAQQGHLHYRVDNGYVIATPYSKLSFHDLAPGTHQISVFLAGNDHSPLGPQQTLTVKIP